MPAVRSCSSQWPHWGGPSNSPVNEKVLRLFEESSTENQEFASEHESLTSSSTYLFQAIKCKNFAMRITSVGCSAEQ
eukprot:1500460-Amphidinium_carterae.1